MHPSGHLSRKTAQNKWKTKWQFSRKAVFLAPQSEHFKPAAVSGASSFLLCLELFKLSNICGGGSSERLLPVHTWKLLLRGVESNGGNLPSLPTASAGSTGGYRGALQRCKPARLHLQPDFTGKGAYSSFQVTLETKPSPLPSIASTAVPTSISHWCGAGFAAMWAQGCCSYPGN